MKKRTFPLISSVILFALSQASGADDIGHGVDGPNAVPENPDETAADSTTSFWNVVLETFTFSTEE